MKNHILLICLLVGSFTFAQKGKDGIYDKEFNNSVFHPGENWKINNQQVVWQKVYEGTPDYKNTKFEWFGESGRLFPKAVTTSWKYSSYLLDPLHAIFQIDEKEGRYRVTVYNIQFGLHTQSGTTRNNETLYNAETWLLRKKNTEFRNYPENFKLIDAYFDNIFKPKGADEDDNW